MNIVKNIFKRLLALIAIAYVGYAIFALFFAHPLIFPAPKPTYQDSKHIMKLTLEDGSEISARYWPNPEAEHTLLYSHGNGQDIGMITPLMEKYQAAGWAVLAYDYPGYGTSHGEPSEEGCYQAVNAAYAHLTETLDIDPSEIVLYGYSLGSGPSTDLARREPVAGLIVEGAFVSIHGVYTRYNPLPWNVFNNICKLEEIEVPSLFIHGTEDTVVAFWNGQALYKASQARKMALWAEGAAHGNLIDLEGERYWNTLEKFKNSL
tara:strand:- start:25718 stop:26506 length:789 start_codon:yes stop_codon:yes gene_type:complete